MIAHVRGTLLEKHPNQAIVETGGVGYEVTIPVSTFSSLPEVGQQASLRIYTHVREDTLALFGFATAEEKVLFERLISVSGIGPRLAVTVLSGLAAPVLIQCIRAGDVAQLVRIPGVGKKTAERMVLELREKLEGIGSMASVAPGAPVSALSAVEEDVLSALVNLGCQRPAAETALRKALAAGTRKEFDPLFRRSLELVR
jgi:Holliday junction DNA helicase RuvA